MILSKEELTAIYNKANDITGGKNPSLSTERIFKAMQAAYQAGQAVGSKTCTTNHTLDTLLQCLPESPYRERFTLEIAKLQLHLAESKEEVAHWKANHANQVKMNQILRDRPDLPLERTQASGLLGLDLKKKIGG